MVIDEKPTPATPSSAYLAMKPGMEMVSTIMRGAAAIRKAGEKFLPRYSAEGQAEYNRRLMGSPWRPEFEDIIRSLASKPFTKEVAIRHNTSENIRTFLEDVDTLGNNLQRFARQTFQGALANGYHGILVDYSTTVAAQDLTDERILGARPYWVQVPAEDLIALYTQNIGGRTIVVHARILEQITERNGFGEVSFNQVRVLEPGKWEIWRQSKETGKEKEWLLHDKGVVSLPEIPLVIFYTGRREGEIVHAPLLNLADMQIELYRSLSRQEEILTYAGSPMLSASGMSAPLKTDDPIEVGPRRILYAPPSDGGGTPSWSWIQPAASNITAISDQVESVIEDMKRLGMQPLKHRTGNITATASSIEGAKAHSSIQDWAHAFKDALEQALVYTSQWLNEKSTAEVSIHTDFGADVDGATDMPELLKMRMAGEISRETYWDELVRRGKLSPQFNPDEEQIKLDEEGIAMGMNIIPDVVPPNPTPMPPPNPMPMPAPPMSPPNTTLVE